MLWTMDESPYLLWLSIATNICWHLISNEAILYFMGYAGFQINLRQDFSLNMFPSVFKEK